MLSLDSIRAALVYRSLNLNYCKRKPIRKNKTPSASKNKTIGRKTNLDFSTIEKNFFFYGQNVGKACYESYFLSEAIWKLLISTEDSSDSSFPKFLGKKFKAICKIRSFWLLQKLIHYFNNKSIYKTVRTIYITTTKWQWPAQKIFSAHLITFTEEIINGRLHFSCRAEHVCLTHFVLIFPFIFILLGSGKHEYSETNFRHISLVQNCTSLIWYALPIYYFV